MRFITLNSAVLALLISSPVMWAAANGQADPKTALLRYLAALAFASIGLAVINGMLEAYRAGNGAPQRREADQSPDPSSARSLDSGAGYAQADASTESGISGLDPAEAPAA